MVLFDLDNTLVDRAGFRRWAKNFAQDRGLDEGAVELLCVADQNGLAPREQVFQLACEKYHLADTVDELIAEYRASYPKLIRPDYSVAAAIRLLRTKHWRIGILTNGPPTQREKIDRAGLTPLVDAICISAEFGIEKPEPAIFKEAVRLCGGDRDTISQGWMVGDSPVSDIAGGQSVGLRTVWLHHGRTWTEGSFSPDTIATDVPDAVQQILLASDEAL